MDAQPFRIRHCTPLDEKAVYEVCLQTGDSGQNATHLYSDPLALGHIYVGPYLKLEPELAFALEDDVSVCGYVLGALNSRKFYDAYLTQWLPEIRRTHPEPKGNPATWSATEKIYYEYYHPEIYYPGSFHDYPSHLHIDLLARAQGLGFGTRMIATLIAELEKRDSPGVHLALSSANRRAEHFYSRLGFVELARVGSSDRQTVFMGKRLK